MNYLMADFNANSPVADGSHQAADGHCEGHCTPFDDMEHLFDWSDVVDSASRYE